MWVAWYFSRAVSVYTSMLGVPREETGSSPVGHHNGLGALGHSNSVEIETVLTKHLFST